MQKWTGSIPSGGKYFLSLKIFLHHSGGSQISIIHESNLGKVFVNFVIRVNESLQKSFDAKHASEASRTVAPDDAPKLDVKTIFKQRILKLYIYYRSKGKIKKIMTLSRDIIFLWHLSCQELQDKSSVKHFNTI